MKTIYLALALGLRLLLCDLQATDRYFHDLETTSPNGRFQLEARSPDNVEGPWKKAFQARFHYRLREMAHWSGAGSGAGPLNRSGR